MKEICEICKSEAELMIQEYEGYRAGTKFKIYQCETCFTSFSLPREDATNLYDFIYKNSEIVPGYNRYHNYYKSIKSKAEPLKYLTESEEAYWGVVEALKSNIVDKKKDRILEIGSGLGYLTYGLRKENYNVKGLDISKEAVDKANSYFGNYYECQDLFEYVKTNGESFDFVILTEVIEHVLDPISFIEAIVKLLKKGGRIILTTPNKSIALEDIVWDSESPPIHHWWLSERSIEQIASKLNLKIDFVNYKKYYRKFPGEYHINKVRKNQFRAPIVNENWELVSAVQEKKPNTIKLFYKTFVKSISFITSTFKFIYLQLKVKITPNTIVYGERGKILCAVLKK